MNTEKNEFRKYLISAIDKQTDPRGYLTHVFMVRLGDTRAGAAVVTTAIGTPDEGVELAMVAIKTEYRGKGFGAMAVDAILNQYLSRGSVYARCLPASVKLRQMLLRRDFTEVGMTGDAVILRHPAVGLLRYEVSGRAGVPVL